MKKVLFTLSLLFTIVLVTGCFFESVTSIRVVSGIKASWDLDEEIDLHSIVIEVVVDGKVNKTVYGDTEGVSIVGLDTTTSGQKTAVVSYEGVSVNVSYLVVGNDSKARSVTELVSRLNDETVTVITLEPGTYDFFVAEQIYITRSVVIRAAQEGTVKLRNAVVKIDKTAPASVVEFRNVEFIKSTLSSSPTNLKIEDSERPATHDTPITGLDRVVLNNVTFTATGETTGLRTGTKTHFEMYNSKFVTPTQDDYFNYMMHTNSTKLNNVLIILENNEFKCNFWYGLGQISQANIRGNLFEGTIPVDTHLLDSAYAPIYNVGKQPVVFHASTPSSGPNAGRLRLVIENNTFKNVENLLRVYNIDLSDVPIGQDLTFNNNTAINVNYLVNHSAMSYTKNVLAIVEAGLKQGSQIMNTTKAVIQNNTEITGNIGSVEMSVVGANNERLYKGLVYQEKGTTDAANRYYYIGKVKVYTTTPVQCLARVVDGVPTYYVINTAYSADGLDTRTITKIDDSNIINRLNGYLDQELFVLTPFIDE